MTASPRTILTLALETRTCCVDRAWNTAKSCDKTGLYPLAEGHVGCSPAGSPENREAEADPRKS